MYNKVVLLLDGSDLAEAALPHLEEIAKSGAVSDILLVSVTEPIRGQLSGSQASAEYASSGGSGVPSVKGGTVATGLIYSGSAAEVQRVPVTLGKMAKTALDYLVRISNGLEAKGLKSQVNVLVGDPAEEIVRFVGEQRADLVIMASRGKSGFGRWDLGNVADKVLRSANVPVLLVKPQPSFKETKSRRKGKAT